MSEEAGRVNRILQQAGYVKYPSDPRPLRVRDVGRTEDEPRSVLIALSDEPTDDELRSLHEYLRRWIP